MRTAWNFLLGVVFVASWASSNAFADETGGFTTSADFRFRLEQDWDSQRADGRERDDRARARIRARLKFVYRGSDDVQFGLRVRSGSDASHQSPHITLVDFNRGNTGDLHFNLDQYYVRAARRGVWAWAGRNGFPFWKQNEMFWDDDATLPGAAAGWSIRAREDVNLRVTAGYFALPVGMQRSNGTLGAGQAVLAFTRGDRKLAVAAGFFGFSGGGNDPDAALLLRGNGSRDYQVSQVSAKASADLANRPLSLGMDWFRNHQDYAPDDPDPFTAAHHDATDGWVGAIAYGATKSAGDWLLAVYYANIDALALNSSYAQDDWVRWGSAAEARAVDLEGWEFRNAWAVTGRLTAVARLYLVESISSDEDGKRGRVDLNWKF